MPKAKTPNKKISRATRVQKKTPSAVRKPKVAAKKIAKPVRAKAQPKRSSKTQASAVSPIQPELVTQPTIVAAPAPTTTPPSATPATNYSFKELPQAQGRWQLWFAVTAVMVIIFVIWLAVTQRNFASIPSSVSDSVKNAEVEILVDDIEQNYATLKDNMQELSDIASEASDLNAGINTNSAVTPANTNTNELNNLFSDLQ